MINTPLKLLDTTDTVLRCEWEVNRMRFKYLVAQAMRQAIETKARKTINRFLKDDFIKLVEDLLDSDPTWCHLEMWLGVKHMSVRYENTRTLTQETFDLRCDWHWAEPFPEGYMPPGSGVQTSTDGIRVARVPRRLNGDLSALDKEMMYYGKLNEQADALAAKIPQLPEACKRYNAALREFAEASKFGETYPLTLVVPYYSLKF